jgi:hypothetical protein
MRGIRKLPRMAGIEGIRKKKTMVTPCMVNMRLYMSAVSRVPLGVSRLRRIIMAKKPPMKKKNVTEAR